jgi:hypothetical protein
MRSLSTGELLDYWEQGAAQCPAERAVALLAAVCQDAEPHEIAAISIGERDRRLLLLRERLFGPGIVSVADCPSCGATVEMRFNVEDMLVSGGAASREPFRALCGGFEAAFRLPNSTDLREAGAAATEEEARHILLRRCLLQVHPDTPAEALPPAVTRAISDRMAEADPQADVQLNLSCPQCAAAWSAPFDIEAFLWTEIAAWAGRTLQEVHGLARAYGWREQDILSLSATRRRIYLEMAQG